VKIESYFAVVLKEIERRGTPLVPKRMQSYGSKFVPQKMHT
jgi:hypothetical protein